MDVIAILVDKKNFYPSIDYEILAQKTLEKTKNLTNIIYQLDKKGLLKLDKTLKREKTGSFKEVFLYLSTLYPEKNFFILNAYSAALDISATKEMILEHEKDHYDFTYSEMTPDGILPEIMSFGILPFILKTVLEKSIFDFYNFRSLFASDISSYDSNIFFYDNPFYELHQNFVPDQYLHCKVLENIAKEDASLITLFETKKELFFPCPSFYQIELTHHYDSFRFSILERDLKEMDIKNLSKVLHFISEYSVDALVAFSIFGDPMFYTQKNLLLPLLQKYSQLHFCFTFSCETLDEIWILDLLKLENVSLIFDISFLKETDFVLHKNLENNAQFAQITEFLQKLEDKKHVFIQVSKNIYNKDELYEFYQKWSKTFQVIIREMLPIYQKEDISFPEIFPPSLTYCLHLLYDMYIDIDGKTFIHLEDFIQKSDKSVFDTKNIPLLFQEQLKIYQKQRKGEGFVCKTSWEFHH